MKPIALCVNPFLKRTRDKDDFETVLIFSYKSHLIKGGESNVAQLNYTPFHHSDNII